MSQSFRLQALACTVQGLIGLALAQPLPAECVDALNGSAELGSAASCAVAYAEAAVVAANAGSWAGPCAELHNGVQLGNICARTCGWCTALLAFTDMEQIDVAFCSAHSAATCVPASGSATSTSECEDKDLIGAVGGLHPNDAREVCEGSMSSPTGCEYRPGANSPPGCVVHPNKFSVDEVAWVSGSGDGTQPIAVAIKAQKLDGAAVGQISVDTLTSFPQPVPMGHALQFVALREMMFRQVMPGTRAFAASDAAAEWRALIAMSGSPMPALDLLASAGNMPFLSPQQIEINMIMEQLHEVSEMEFTFTVQFRLMMSWYDTSIFQECNGVDPWDSAECPEVWRPDVAFLNLREVEWLGQSELYAMPAGWDAQMGGDGSEPATVFLLARAVGTYTAPMGFQLFPNDVQSLPIQLYLKHLPDPMMRSQIVITPKATLSADLAARNSDNGGKDTLSGWNIDSTNAHEFEHIDFDIPSLQGGGGAFDNYMNKIMELNLPVEDSTRLSAAEFNIVISRKARYYYLNYVLIVALLTAVSWLTFFLDPAALDARAGVALTLLLAIGVFQLILNDTMPKTGYLTPMHVFVLVSTFWVVLVLVESLIVCELSRRQAVKEAVAAKITSQANRFSSIRSHSAASSSVDAERANLSAEEAEPVVEHVETAKPSCLESLCNTETLVKTLTDHMDRASLVLFPLSYAIATAVVFS